MTDNIDREIFDSIDALLRRFVRSRVATDEAAEDVVQDVWFGFYRSLDRGAIIENIEGWLYRSARNRIIDLHRKIKPLSGEIEFDELENDDSAIAETESNEFFDLLESALDDLPENQKDVFIRNEIDDFTLQEIADESDENLKTIISRKRYAVTKLRAALGEYYEEYFS